MLRLLKRLDENARKRVNEAVKEAERKTLAEILPVVARSSGSYDRAEDIIGLWLGAVSVGACWFFFQGVALDVGWGGESVIRVGFWTLLLVFIVGFVVGVVLADRIPGLRRLFIPDRELEVQAVIRAKTVFFDRRLHRTSRGTGILLYVSLLERRVVVLADDAVADKLSERALGEVRVEILGGIANHDLAQGLIDGIERIGNLLGGTLPAGDDRIDEVPSEVVVLDD